MNRLTAGLVFTYLALMLLVPSELVLPQIGSAGTPANLLGLGMLFWWLLGRLAGLIPTAFTPMHLALALLVLCVLLSLANGLAHGWVSPVDIGQKTDAVWSPIPVTAQELQTKSVLGATRGLMAVGSWVGLALVLIDGVRSWRDVDRVVAVLVHLTTVVAVIGIYQYFTGDNLARHISVPGLQATYETGATIARSDLVRVSATTTHPIEFSVLVTAVFPLALHRALNPTVDGNLIRFATVYLPAALIGLAVPMTVSRTAIIALMAALVVLFMGWSWNRRLWTLVCLPVILVLMRSALPGLLGTIRALFTQATGDPSVTGRTDDYGAVLRLYAEHPWLGRGSFTFIPRYYRTLDNQLLMNLVELGVLGLAATLLLFATGYYLARYCKRHATDPWQEHLGLALSASLLATYFTYLTFDAWGFAKTGALTFVLLGLAGATRALRIPKSGHDTPPSLAQHEFERVEEGVA